MSAKRDEKCQVEWCHRSHGKSNEVRAMEKSIYGYCLPDRNPKRRAAP